MVTSVSAPRRLSWLSPHGAVVGLLWLISVGSALGVWVITFGGTGGGAFAEFAEPFDVVGPSAGAVLATFGVVVVMRGGGRVYGWLMLAMGVSATVVVFSGAFAVATHETGSPWVAVWIQDLWMTQQFIGWLLLPALFPDGRPAAPKWRRPVQSAAGAWIALIVAFMVAERAATNLFFELPVAERPANPTGWLPIPMTVFNVAWLTIALTSIGISVGSLATRWRRAGAELRQQVKTVLLAFGVLLVLFVVDLINQALVAAGIDLGLRLPLNVASAVAVVGLVVAIGLAVLRHRLYAVDLVVNRTAVYLALTLGGVAIYVGVVTAIGSILPIRDPFPALMATGVIAVIFAPMRDRLQAGVNRLMFGQRREPYAVLSDLGRLLAESRAPGDLLRTLTEQVASSLKLGGMAVDLEEDGEWRRWAESGEFDPNETTHVPLHHQGEVVGRLVVGHRRPGESLTEEDLALLEDIGHQAGALVRSVRLTSALQLARERLVLAREEERRRIRHDLHDEVGPTLASQTLQLDAVLERIADEPVAATELVKTLKDQNQQLVADIRRLVNELRPPTLDELGVDGALAAYAWQLEHSGHLEIEVRTEPAPLPELPAAVEVAAYRIVREAITNTVHHAHADHCLATLQVTADSLTVSVRDDGNGISARSPFGVGLGSMRKRAEELGGTFRVMNVQPTGTQVVATLPMMQEARSGTSNGAKTPERAGRHG